MFNDLALSRDVVSEYRARLPAHHPGHQLSVMVLQRSAWPFATQKLDADLPLWVRFPLLLDRKDAHSWTPFMIL